MQNLIDYIFKKTELNYSISDQQKYDAFVGALPKYGLKLEDNKIIPTVFPSEDISDKLNGGIARIDEKSRLVLPSRELPEMLAYQKHLISVLYVTTNSIAGYDFFMKSTTPEEWDMINEAGKLAFTLEYKPKLKMSMRVTRTEFKDDEKERAAELLMELERRNFWGLEVVLFNYEGITGKPLPKQVHF